MEFLAHIILFFLPAGIANMIPIFACHIPALKDRNLPLDFGRTYRGKRITGDNKTWRGLITGIIGGALTAWLVSLAYDAYSTNTLLTVVIGANLGAGALLGDAIESFVKRQLNVAPGEPWFPFDQTDYIIGGLLFIYPLVPLPPELMAGIFITYFGLHLVASYIGFLLGLKPKPI